ncbi:hypothetical protein ACVDG8_029305 [Mesorhizobium sp. ORM8.1]
MLIFRELGSARPDALPSREMVNGIYGPEPVHAEAMTKAIIATVDRLTLQSMRDAAGRAFKP